MKNNLLILLTLVMLLFPAPSVQAAEQNFPSGSLIIPMDSFYQPDSDGGILEAYGLVFNLLKHLDGQGEHDITVYWVINEAKATIDATDIVIEDLTLVEGGVVAKLYNHAGGTSSLTFNTGDSYQRITYSGAPFIVDGVDAETAKAIINQSSWSAVEVHVAQVPFKAPVYREMHGTPPKIALMNNSESKTGGNAAILEAYLRLAGICADVYDVVTPNEIRDGILTTGGYDFLWAPHWTGYSSYSSDADSDGTADVEEIVLKVKEFVKNGKGVFAECASIETFEHSQNGRYLSTKGFAHNGGTNNAATIIYNDLATPNSQVGNFQYAPEGGHLHNWRPFVSGDPHTNVGQPPDARPPGNPHVTAGNPSTYVDTVTRFATDNTGWDYYVGGYAYGDSNNGYVVYLGGHKYAQCKGGVAVGSAPGAHPLKFDFHKDIDNEEFTLLVKYSSGSTTTVNFSGDDLTAIEGDPLEVDLTTASVDKKKLLSVTLRNNGESNITVDSTTLSWVNGHQAQKLKKITDEKTDEKLYDNNPGVASNTELTMTDFSIETSSGGASASCTNNSDCSWKNIAGVRYVLNTLFNIKFQIQSREYVRSAPVVVHPYLYQGSFEYPTYYGHLRRYNVESNSASASWDTAENITNANTGNTNGRKVYTAKQNVNGTWSKINFDEANLSELRAPLDVTPGDGDDTDEIRVINRLRGKDWDNENSSWVERTVKLGGIMHSAPVIVETNSRTGSSRAQIAYVGDLYGMLHAIDIATGTEKWAYIPRNLLGKLKNDRTDPNAIQDFAAVDGTPTAKDVYYDHDSDGDKEWRTILISHEGFGGKYMFALDVTDPDNWSVLWEATDTVAPGGGMGHAFRVAINKVKSPVTDNEGNITDYEIKWMVFVATGYAAIAEVHGGINVFAYDLQSGAKLWHFSQSYSDAVNDIPGAITLFDIDDDGFMDRIYVGDMNGRLWELNVLDGTNPNGADQTGKQIPLWNCGVGKPIAVSPSITRINPVVVVFGTGGTDWASNAQSYAVYAVNATDKQGTPTYANGAGTLLWKKDLAVGEKVWSSPTIASGQVYIGTSFGTMESGDPRNDLLVTGQSSGNLYSIKLSDGTTTFSIADIGKIRGSAYVDRQHAYLTTIDNQIVQIGDANFAEGTADNVVLRAWRERN